jgi:hypothetical protein
LEKQIFFRKMKHSLTDGCLSYTLCGDDITSLIGRNISLRFTGTIECIGCGRKTKKSFGQGYCYPCLRDKACCDSCIVSPERCHYSKGTCREPQWGEQHCLIPHVVYLASASEVKVGVTGAHKLLERWGDQGARQAMVIGRFSERLHAGECEVALKKLIGDKTDWRALLMGKDKEHDLVAVYSGILGSAPPEIASELLSVDEARAGLTELSYPVKEYLPSAKTWDFDKEALVSGMLTGIRGQYLLVGGKGLNVRKFQGYEVVVVCE